MRAIVPALAAASLAFLSTPANAADPAQLDCPLASLTAEQRGALDAYIAEQGELEDVRFLAFRGSVEQCAARFHWSDAARDSAANFGFSSATEAHMRRVITGRGVDLRPIESALLADRAVMDAEVGSPAQRQALLAFVRRNVALVVGRDGRGSDEQLLTWVGAFIAARAVRDGARARFLAE